MIRLTLYTRPECKLCDAAKFVLQRVQADIPFELKEVDISAPGKERLLHRFGEHIPVICCGAEEWFRHRVVESELREKVIKARRDTADGKYDPLTALFKKPLFRSPNPLANSTMLRRGEGVPLAFWRAISNTRAFCILLMAVALTIISADQLWFGGASHKLMIAYGVFFFSALAAWAFVPRVVRRRYRALLGPHDHLICLECGYVLAGLPDEHVCPECGRAYVANEVRTAWMNWLATGDMRRSTF